MSLGHRHNRPIKSEGRRLIKRRPAQRAAPGVWSASSVADDHDMAGMGFRLRLGMTASGPSIQEDAAKQTIARAEQPARAFRRDLDDGGRQWRMCQSHWPMLQPSVQPGLGMRPGSSPPTAKSIGLTLKRLGNPLCGKLAPEWPRTSSVYADSPPAPTSDDLVSARLRRFKGRSAVNTSRHHRTALRNRATAAPLTFGDDAAPNAAPSIAMVIAHTLDGGGSLDVVGAEGGLFRVIDRLLFRARIPLPRRIKSPFVSNPSASFTSNRS